MLFIRKGVDESPEFAEEYADICAEAQEVFPLETYLTLLSLIELRAAMLENDDPYYSTRLKAITTTLDFMLSCHPQDWLLHKIAKDLNSRFPELSLEAEEGKKERYTETYHLGLKAWLQGDIKKPKRHA